MSNIKLPPPPTTTTDQSVWSAWYLSIKGAINQLATSLKWSLLDFTGSNLTNIVTRNHNDLQSLQGGSTTERYHVSSTQATAIAAFNATQWNALTSGGTTNLHYHTISASASLSGFGTIASNGMGIQTVTVTGAVVGKAVMLGPPASIEAGLTWCGYVSAANTVTIRLHNTSGGSVTPATNTWEVRVEY